MSLEFLAAMLHAQDMRELPACDRFPAACNAALIENIDDAGRRHVHFCHWDGQHGFPDSRVPTHRCVCGQVWAENVGLTEPAS